jgi:uncharacterized protein YgiM (DUF1202 family)
MNKDLTARKGHIRHTRPQRQRKELHDLVHPRRIGLRIAAAIIIAAAALLLILTSCIPATPGAWLTSAPPPPTPQPPQPPQPTATLPVWVTVTGLPSATPAATRPAAPTCIVSTGLPDGTVNVRSGPGMHYPVVDVVSEGEILPLYGEPEHGWQRVCTARLVEGWFYTPTWCSKEN